jgi:hypothetical protein
MGARTVERQTWTTGVIASRESAAILRAWNDKNGLADLIFRMAAPPAAPRPAVDMDQGLEKSVP